MPPFRSQLPIRTCQKKYKNYRAYKPYLREDFNKRCGYCDDRDIICGGVRGFHIDHFRPQKYFPDLQNNYNNLVYSCPYCNGGKSDDWPSKSEHQSAINGQGYIDPCSPDFDSHFERYETGKIRPLTDIGNYMFQKLKLGLKRHELAWKYEQLELNLAAITKEIENFSGNPNKKEKLKHYQLRVAQEFLNYKRKFEETL